MEENETQTPANDTDINMVGVIQDGKFIPYGMTGIRGGIPVYVFNTYADYEAAAPTLPETCMFITLDDLDTGGFEFDSELSETSENAVQNKIITAALRKKAGFDSPGAVQFTDSTAVTERDSGFGLSAIEKNAAVEGSLAYEIDALNKKSLKRFFAMDFFSGSNYTISGRSSGTAEVNITVPENSVPISLIGFDIAYGGSGDLAAKVVRFENEQKKVVFHIYNFGNTSLSFKVMARIGYLSFDE